MSSKRKHQERSRKTHSAIYFKSDDRAKHELDMATGMLLFKPKTQRASRFIEDRPNAKKILGGVK